MRIYKGRQNKRKNMVRNLEKEEENELKLKREKEN